MRAPRARAAQGDHVEEDRPEAGDETEPQSADRPAAAWDGRRRHVIDRALDYAALAAQGLSDTAIARRRRKSRGYVSILRRLGQAIAELPEAELGAFRTPRIGFALAQRLVRADVPPAEIRAQLRSAAGGFSTHGVDYRRRGLRRSHVAGGTGGAVRGRGTSGWAWAWDATLFQQDPAAFVRAHAERLVALQVAIARRAARDVEARALAGRAVGQPLAQLAAAVATARRAGTLGAGGGTPAEVAAVRQLEALRVAVERAVATVLEAAPGAMDALAARAGSAPEALPPQLGDARSPRSPHPAPPASGRRVIPLTPEERVRLEAGDLDE